MSRDATDKFSAGEQGLGYLYQGRLALLLVLQQPEDAIFCLEKDDDIDFLEKGGTKSLASLKHRSVGNRVTDLSIDFWKSVRIWLSRYTREGKIASNLRFLLFTTSIVSETSRLKEFLPNTASLGLWQNNRADLADEILASTTSGVIQGIAKDFDKLEYAEKEDFLSRILILDCAPRIEDIPTIIRNDFMRSIRREYRVAVFERLEGWWNDLVIRHLTGYVKDGILGYEVSDKLSTLAEEYRLDNLPVTYRGREPDGEIDVENDPRMFVRQLREIGISSNRIRNAILDYYRAFEQRSEWARENLLGSEEVEEFEDRLVDEWNRYKDVLFEALDNETAEEVLLSVGKQLYLWADQESGNIESLRIRPRVSEPYVVRGSFHILANAGPEPKVFWHPHFLDRLSHVLEVIQ